MPKELLADTDFFIALYKKDDANHGKALTVLDKIGEGGYSLSISVLVYSEIATILSQRVNRTLAKSFIDDVEESGINIIFSTDELFLETKNIFSAQRSKNVSFTDTMNVAIARQKNMGYVVSFDKDYKKNNLKRFEID